MTTGAGAVEMPAGLLARDRAGSRSSAGSWRQTRLSTDEVSRCDGSSFYGQNELGSQGVERLLLRKEDDETTTEDCAKIVRTRTVERSIPALWETRYRRPSITISVVWPASNGESESPVTNRTRQSARVWQQHSGGGISPLREYQHNSDSGASSSFKRRSAGYSHAGLPPSHNSRPSVLVTRT